MSDVSGIPNMGFGGGNFFAPTFSYNPQLSAGQASAAYAPEIGYSQNVVNNLYGGGANEGFGRQTDYYSALGASYGRQVSSLNPYGVFGESGGGGGEISYNNVTNPAPLDISGGGGYGGGLFSGNAGSLGSGGGGYGGSPIDWSGVGNAAAGMGGGVQDPYPNMSMPGGLGMPASSPSGASPIDWGGLFGGALGGSRTDPAPGMAMPGGLNAPMTFPQQGQPQPAKAQEQPAFDFSGANAGWGNAPTTSTPDAQKLLGYDPNAGPAAALAAVSDKGLSPDYWGDILGSKSAPEGTRTYDFKPMFEGGGGDGFGSGGTESQSFGGNAGSFGGNIFDYTTGGAPAAPTVAQDTAGSDTSAAKLAEQARARLADIIGSPETQKVVEAADKAPEPAPPPAARDAPPLSNLGDLPPEFPDFTKLYPEYGQRYGDDTAVASPERSVNREQDVPRPPADVPEFPAARLAPNGQEPELFVVHHTSGRGDPASIVADWAQNRPGIGAQYIMDRNAVIHDTLAEYGYSGTNQAKDIAVPGSGVSKADTANRNIVGMEIVANNANDVTPAQQAALVQFANTRYPNTPFYGHGEISTNKEPSEGVAGAQAVLASRPAPFNFDWSNAPIPGPEQGQGVNQGQNIPRPPADIPAEAIPLPTARPAAANIAQANSVLDSRILDLVQKNSPGDVNRIPSSIANQTLREALGNTMTGGMIRSGLTPYLPQMGVSQAEFDKAYNSGLAVPVSRFYGGDQATRTAETLPPGELKANWNQAIYEGQTVPTMQRDERLGPDPNPFTGFRQSPNVEDRRFDPALTDTQRQALSALVPRGMYLPNPNATIPQGGQLGEMLGTSQIGNLEANASARQMTGQGAAIPLPRITDVSGDEAASLNNVVGPRGSAFDLSPAGFGEGGYGNTFAQPVSRGDLAAQIAEPGRVKMDFSGFSPSPEPRQGGVGPQATLEPDFMDVIKEVESSGNPDKVTGSYKGLYQLDDKEFRKYGGTGSIFDPEQNTKAASAKMLDETQRVQDILGRALTPPEQYMVHQQGVAGSLAHLANPDELAWKNFQGAANSSEARAKDAIWKNMTPEMQNQFGNDVNNVTSRDFLRLWDDRYYGILNR